MYDIYEAHAAKKYIIYYIIDRWLHDIVLFLHFPKNQSIDFLNLSV